METPDEFEFQEAITEMIVVRSESFAGKLSVRDVDGGDPRNALARGGFKAGDRVKVRRLRPDED
jgi:hypothetical protein